MDVWRRITTGALAIVLTFALAAALAGCAGDAEKPAATHAPDDPAGQELCFESQYQAQAELFTWLDEGNRVPQAGTSPEGLKRIGAIQNPPVCPAGGDFVFNPVDAEFACSIHGWAPD
jgi:hypothetical protein